MTVTVDGGSRATDGVAELAGLAERFETTAALTCSALEYWRQSVRGALLTLSADQAGVALRGLAAWYERMYVDLDYHQHAPDEGLNALINLRSSTDPIAEKDAVVTDWAIRVAEELAACRARCWSEGGSDDGEVALAKLELALHSALERSHG